MTHLTRGLEIFLPAKASVPSGNQSKERVLDSSFSSDISTEKVKEDMQVRQWKRKGEGNGGQWCVVGIGREEGGLPNLLPLDKKICQKYFQSNIFSRYVVVVML